LRTLEAAGWKFETWAPSLLPAISNEKSVRVLFSKKALIWVSPASRSSALRGPRLNAIHGSASSRIRRMSSADSPSIPSRWRWGKGAVIKAALYPSHAPSSSGCQGA